MKIWLVRVETQGETFRVPLVVEIASDEPSFDGRFDPVSIERLPLHLCRSLLLPEECAVDRGNQDSHSSAIRGVFLSHHVLDTIICGFSHGPIDVVHCSHAIHITAEAELSEWRRDSRRCRVVGSCSDDLLLQYAFLCVVRKVESHTGQSTVYRVQDMMQVVLLAAENWKEDLALAPIE